eukprot:Nk52_evm25s293 gene=Nk52_evmTU25s293
MLGFGRIFNQMGSLAISGFRAASAGSVMGARMGRRGFISVAASSQTASSFNSRFGRVIRSYSSAAGGKGKAAASSSSALSKTLTTVGILGGLATAGFVWGGYPDEKDSGMTLDDFVRRIKTRFDAWRLYFADPNKDILLPDQFPRDSPYYYEYTLCIEFDKVLAYTEWDPKDGWKTILRPGAAYFLFYLAQFYELVLFTSKGNSVADPLLNTIDPEGAVRYRLYRGSTRYTDGHHVKDLSILNRDLKKTLILDYDEESYKLQPYNGVKIKPYKGEKDDKELLELLNFMETIVRTGVDDVREVMKAYEGKDVGRTFNALLQSKLDAAKKEQEEIKQKSVWSMFGRK